MVERLLAALQVLLNAVVLRFFGADGALDAVLEALELEEVLRDLVVGDLDGALQGNQVQLVQFLHQAITCRNYCCTISMAYCRMFFFDEAIFTVSSLSMLSSVKPNEPPFADVPFR